MNHKVKLDPDLLRSLKERVEEMAALVERMRDSGEEGKTRLSRGDIKSDISEDGSYVTIEDVANGSNLIEIDAQQFREMAELFLESIGVPTSPQVGCFSCVKWARLKKEHRAPTAGDTYCADCGALDANVSFFVAHGCTREQMRAKTGNQ